MRRMIGLAILLLSSSQVWAADEFEISASNVPGLKTGSKLSKGARIELPDGARISFIDRSGSGAVMRECSGRYQGPIEGCTASTGSGPAATAPGGTRGAVRRDATPGGGERSPTPNIPAR